MWAAGACQAPSPATVSSPEGGSTDGGETEPSAGARADPGATDDGRAGDETAASASATGGSSGGEPVEDLEPGPAFELQALTAPHAAIPGARGPGQAWGDVDSDGWLDLVTVGGDLPSQLWHNEADGTFALHAATADLAPYVDAIGAYFVDYDNDGDPDLFLVRMGTDVMLRNDAGAFVDVSSAVGLDEPAPSTTAAWADYDGDGRLDVYVARTGTWPDALYHAQSDGTFVEVSELLPGRIRWQAYAVAWSDLDGDGDADLYVGNDKSVGNQAWRNDGHGCGGWCFVEIGSAWGLDRPVDSMGVAVGDLDNDLDLDLSVTDNHTHLIQRSRLDQGEMVFDDVSRQMGVEFDAFGWGTVFFDYDNDGWLDLFVANGHTVGPDPDDRLFHNEGGWFSDASKGSGCIEPGWGLGVATADYDHDGAVDLVVGNRGSRHDLFRNRNPIPRHWLTVQLIGGGPVNRDAVGSRVWMTTTDDRVLMQEVALGSGIGSQSSLRLHFGLGDADVAAIEIRWPDGTVESPPAPAADQLWTWSYRHP